LRTVGKNLVKRENKQTKKVLDAAGASFEEKQGHSKKIPCPAGRGLDWELRRGEKAN